ncbi:AbrB/MazE/SpoVT family DNA-binding domain-containing protein [bacterium]|nr:AbrB/MazE/SpoVT family DNA-binding domain-containing protein [bacterium]
MAEHSLTDCFVGAATVGRRGQIVIPTEARKRLGIEPGDRLLIVTDPQGSGVAFVKFDEVSEVQRGLQAVLASMYEA